MNEDDVIYRIDKKDIIISVSRNWESFARANGCCTCKWVEQRLQPRECGGAFAVGFHSGLRDPAPYIKRCSRESAPASLAFRFLKNWQTTIYGKSDDKGIELRNSFYFIC